MPDIFNSIEPKTNILKGRNLMANKTTDSQKEISIIESLEKKGFSHSPLRSFSLKPNGIKFSAKDPDEKIILLLRKHPFTNLKWIIAVAVGVVVPPFFSFIDFYTFLPLDFRFVLNLMWYLFISAFAMEKFLQWFFNVNVITDERIIDVDFHNLIYREISDANIDQVQDVSASIGGGLRTFLNYGNVKVQTAAEVLNIDFIDVPRPDDVARILRELRVQEEQEKLEGRVR